MTTNIPIPLLIKALDDKSGELGTKLLENLEKINGLETETEICVRIIRKNIDKEIIFEKNEKYSNADLIKGLSHIVENKIAIFHLLSFRDTTRNYTFIFGHYFFDVNDSGKISGNIFVKCFF